MEETTVLQPETIEAAEVATQPEEISQESLTPQDRLNALINRRMGSFDVKMSYQDLKYIKNTIQQKVEWKGPNEAYLVIISLLSLENALHSMDAKLLEPVQIQLPSSTIESINFFLNRVNGKGLDAAQKLFSISMQLRPSMEAFKQIDSEIEAIRSEIEKTEKNA